MKLLSNLFKTKQQKLKESHEKLELLAIYHEMENIIKINDKRAETPLFSARDKLSSTLLDFKSKRDHLNEQWNIAYSNFSWWNKLKYDECLNLSELDYQIRELEKALKEFDQKYNKHSCILREHFFRLEKEGTDRIQLASEKLKEALDKGIVNDINDNSLSAAWIAMLSVPVSFTADLDSANQVYDSLRAVNSNFENMSNTEIWWETLWMSPESHAGLVSLTKGAYFEQLVANDTGGELFEHFNNPGTDITINGVEMQIKATDSVSYINSVDDDIPVIATSEVAEQTGAIDGGYTNEELNNTVEQALGGGVIDAKDTAVDAILSGVGTLGIFATINGLNHASERYNKGVNGVEAIFEGAGVAIEGTAKGLVDASEMVYKAAMSKPSRFVGRTLVKGLKKLDEKLFG